MQWKDVACLCVIVVGIVLVLYGSNYFDVRIGWSGIFLVIGGIFAEITLKIYAFANKKKD